MKECLTRIVVFVVIGTFAGCSTAYKEQPLPFKSPSAYGNAVAIEGAQIGATAFDQPEEAEKAFGFDILGAGMLPIQVVIDNKGTHTLEINGEQTFLEDRQGNLWPILSTRVAYERATKYAKTKEIVSEGAYKGLLGAAVGTIIGAAVGVVTGDDIGAAAGKGAAAGAATGAILGGIGGYTSDQARRSITTDLKDKSLQNRPIAPATLAHGILFFPGEAGSAKHVRLQLLDKSSGRVHVVTLLFSL